MFIFVTLIAYDVLIIVKIPYHCYDLESKGKINILKINFIACNANSFFIFDIVCSYLETYCLWCINYKDGHRSLL